MKTWEECPPPCGAADATGVAAGEPPPREDVAAANGLGAALGEDAVDDHGLEEVIAPPPQVGTSPWKAWRWQLLATGQEQLVTSDGRREVLAEVLQMTRGTSPVDPGASGPPDMVHDGGAGGRWEGQRVTPAVTRSRAKRDGLWPGMFALMATQEDIARSISELSPPDVVETELLSELACDMDTPETYVQAHTGPHRDIWTEAEGKELRGLNATGTFEAAGSE